MKLLLHTVRSDEFMEINQSLALDGVYTTPWDFYSQDLDVAAAIDSLLELMTDSQRLYVQCVSSGFRPLLAEAKKLHAYSGLIVPVIPGDAGGLMALKACRTLHIPAVCASLYDSGQAALAAAGTQEPLVLDLDAIGRHGDSRQVLMQTAEILADQKERLMVAGLRSPEDFRMASLAHPGWIAARADVYQSMLYSPLVQKERETIREQWILSYTADTVDSLFDRKQQTE